MESARCQPTARSLRVLGLAGGSGSGKSTLARALVDRLGVARCLHLQHDRYYRSLPEGVDPATYDFDRPEALDTARLVADLRRLLRGVPARLPRYDFARHRRLAEEEVVEPREWIVLEGILVLWDPELLPLLDYRVYVHAPEDVCLARRLQRDVVERGRDPESVLAQFERSVRPMHARYVAPCRARADLVVDGTADLAVSVDAVMERMAVSRRRGVP